MLNIEYFNCLTMLRLNLICIENNKFHRDFWFALPLLERLDVQFVFLREENSAAQGLKKEVAGMIRDAAELEEQNAKLGNMILELRQELSDAEAGVIYLQASSFKAEY